MIATCTLFDDKRAADLLKKNELCFALANFLVLGGNARIFCSVSISDPRSLWTCNDPLPVPTGTPG